jgi:4-aminobutyrate aminotransferase-like enzyme
LLFLCQYLLQPAAGETELVVNQMKQKGVLISSDSPDHNVLKIKPSLVFNKNNADYLLESLGAVMIENNFRV